MNVSVDAVQLCARSLVPPVVLRQVEDRPAFLNDVARYTALDDDGLLHVTKVCLRNLPRLATEETGPDADLRLVLVPELWERLRPGSRDVLRRISSTLAEYRGDRPSIFSRLLSPEWSEELRAAAECMRQQVTRASLTEVESLVEQTRFAIAGSRAADQWPPDYPVYEAGFTYRLVPVVAWRALARAHEDPRDLKPAEGEVP